MGRLTVEKCEPCIVSRRALRSPKRVATRFRRERVVRRYDVYIASRIVGSKYITNTFGTVSRDDETRSTRARYFE